MNKLLLSFIPALFLAVFLLPTHVYAQALDLTVSPVSLDYSPKPGDVIKDKVTLHNNTNNPLVLKLSAAKLVVDQTGQVVPQDITPDQVATNWIKFDAGQIVAPVKEWYEVPFTINVPQESAYGNYFALVFSPPTTQVGGGSAAVQGNVLVPILLNVQKAGAISRAEITEFKVKDFVSQYLPIGFSVTVKNTGNMHVHPRGNIFIRDGGQKDLAVLEVNPGRSNILPGSSRTFTADWSDGFLVIGSDGKIQINWNKLTSFRIGKYTAYVLLAYDDGQRDVPIESTLTFWVFPYAAVALILIVVAAIVIVIVYAFKALVKREAKKLQT